MRGGFRTGAAVRAPQVTCTDLLLEILALRDQLRVVARSQRRFRQLTVCCGCCCDGCGPGGGKRWCWSTPPLSIVGIAKEYVDAGALARGVLEDRVSIHPVEI